MIYHFDGFTIGANPSDVGGGFTVTDGVGNLIHHEVTNKKGFTNNEAELLGCLFTVKICSPGDTLVTDSRNTIAWVKSGLPKARMDLMPIAKECKDLIGLKNLILEWKGREENWAGIYNEANGL